MIDTVQHKQQREAMEKQRFGFTRAEILAAKGAKCALPLQFAGDFHEGDLVIVRPARDVKHNDIVVALLHDEATVKRFIQIKNRAYLKAENPRFKDIYPKEEWMVQGKVVGVIRQLE